MGTLELIIRPHCVLQAFHAGGIAHVVSIDDSSGTIALIWSREDDYAGTYSLDTVKSLCTVIPETSYSDLYDLCT